MTTKELAELVQLMRAAQKAYFRRKTSAHLALAKELEQQVDHAVAELLAAPRLF